MANFNSLFGTSENDGPKKSIHPKRETKWIHYSKLEDNAKQYRDSSDEEKVRNLAALIDADNGILENLIVRKIDADAYEIIAGHHRRNACKLLVEEKGLEEYAFLPCHIETLSDVRAEFQLYSSNGFVPKSDYEQMHELERMKYLIENYPEEFPHLKSGRMVEKLAEQLHMKKTTVGEYLQISKNLGEKGMKAFEKGEIKKSSAVEMSSLSIEEQNQLIDAGTTSIKEVKKYKEGRTIKEVSEVTASVNPMAQEVNEKEITKLYPDYVYTLYEYSTRCRELPQEFLETLAEMIVNTPKEANSMYSEDLQAPKIEMWKYFQKNELDELEEFAKILVN